MQNKMLFFQHQTLILNVHTTFNSISKTKYRRLESFPPTTGFPTSDSLPMSVRLLQAFEPVTEDEIHAIVLSYKVNCSPEDLIHAKLLSDNMDISVPYWIEIVNLYLSTGSMDGFKSAVITPLLKELEDFVDPEILENYRPISNLTFLSKLIERCVASRLDKHTCVTTI